MLLNCRSFFIPSGTGTLFCCFSSSLQLLYLGGACGDLVAIRCQKQMLFGSGNRCESTFSQVSWARGVSLPDALQLNQFHSLSRYTHVGLDLTWPSNSKKYWSPGRGTCCCLCTVCWRLLLGPSLTDVWKYFLLTSNCLGCNFPLFYFNPFCVLC